MSPLSLWRHVRCFCLLVLVWVILFVFKDSRSRSSFSVIPRCSWFCQLSVYRGLMRWPLSRHLLQSWGPRWTSLNRWAAAVEAAPQTPRARQEAMTTAPAVEARTAAPCPLRSRHTSSPTTAGRPSPTEPAGRKAATSSWAPSVSVRSRFWAAAGAWGWAEGMSGQSWSFCLSYTRVYKPEGT